MAADRGNDDAANQAAAHEHRQPLSPWLLGRLQLADHIALQLRTNADQVVCELATPLQRQPS
ncbi:MAG: hypothetical protein A2461_03895 [Burkholderiales bacterium RIFOXYC2_FULL_59_8]|nr:MAG: hypothetical protein A2461_03895 [Burkholderiales bacterium RIFOXYC2_FULL_59_8]OGB59777.1 MAG: hypothetical protein A2503_10990 [Burkholderiales bacterium RIFOXYD12_FULL_59_19]